MRTKQTFTCSLFKRLKVLVCNLTLIFILHVIVFSQNINAQPAIEDLVSKLQQYQSPCKSPCLADSVKVNMMIELAAQYNFVKPDSTLIIARKALQLSRHAGFLKGEGRSNHQIGNYYYATGLMDSAIVYYTQAISIWDTLTSKYPELANDFGLRKAKGINMLGTVYSETGFYLEALELFLSELKFIEQSSDSVLIAQSYGSIGILYARLKNPAEAEQYFRNSIQISESIGDWYNLATTLSNTSTVYSETGRYEEAASLADSAFNIYKQIQYTRGQAYARLANGNALYALNQYEPALICWYQSLELAQQMGDSYLECKVHIQLGIYFRSFKQYELAREHLLRAIKLADEYKSIELRWRSNNEVSIFYAQTAQFEKAYRHKDLAYKYYDILLQDSTNKQMSRKVIQFEYEKQSELAKVQAEKNVSLHLMEISRQRTINNSIATGASALIAFSLIGFGLYKRKRDADQRQKEAILSLQVSETEMKALRSQMNPHFIFNALQSIQNFLIKNKSDEANKYLLKFSKLMRAVLENSMFSEVSLKKDMQALELYMQLESIRLRYPFTYSFHIDEGIDIETVTIPPLILQPFVENAIWHGLQYKQGPGHIDIRLQSDNGSLLATVEDNGVGRDMSKNVQQPMLLQKQSLGMKLTEDRLKILKETKHFNSKLHITDLLGADRSPLGTKVELSLPFAI